MRMIVQFNLMGWMLMVMGPVLVWVLMESHHLAPSFYLIPHGQQKIKFDFRFLWKGFYISLIPLCYCDENQSVRTRRIIMRFINSKISRNLTFSSNISYSFKISGIWLDWIYTWDPLTIHLPISMFFAKLVRRVPVELFKSFFE